MRLRENRTMSVLLGAAVLVGGVNIAAYAATGGNFLLGKSNSAGKTTTLTNTGKGAPLSLKGRASAPPLTVSSSRKVAKLNADKLDGKDSTAFEAKNSTLTWKTIPLDAGGGWLTGPVECDTGVAQYAVSHGIVYLRGGVCSGSGNAMLNLPAEARPDREVTAINFPAIRQGEGTPALHLISLQANGTFTTETGIGEVISLEGISFSK